MKILYENNIDYDIISFKDIIKDTKTLTTFRTVLYINKLDKYLAIYLRDDIKRNKQKLLLYEVNKRESVIDNVFYIV